MGNGPIGSVEFPEYIQEWHAAMASGTTVALLDDKMNAYFIEPATATCDNATFLHYHNEAFTAGNPYSGYTLVDPGDYFAGAATRKAKYHDLVDRFDPDSIWGLISAKAISRARFVTDRLQEDDVEDVEEDVASFRQNALTDLARAYNRVTATFRDVNAVVGSAFPAALALLESEHEAKIAAHRSALRIQQREQMNIPERKTQLVLGFMSAMLDLHKTQIEANHASIAVEIDYGTRLLTADVDKQERQFELDDRSRKWKLELLQDGQNLLAGMASIPASSMPDRRTWRQQQAWNAVMTTAQLGLMSRSQNMGMGMSLLTGLLRLV